VTFQAIYTLFQGSLLTNRLQTKKCEELPRRRNIKLLLF